METIIKAIKNEIKPLRKEYNLRLKHINNHYQEILEYTNYYGLNFKRHNLVCRFILQKQENSISFTYSYICAKKNCDTYNEITFLKDLDEYPCFSDKDVEEIKSLYQFEMVDNTIKNTVSLETQAELLVRVFKKNYNELTEYVKNQLNNIKAPE